MLPWILCGVMLIIIILLSLKIWDLKNAVQEVLAEFEEHINLDTNTLISVSSGDKQIRSMAVQLNDQLRLLRQQRRQYLAGDQELKNAVTNISHDLRTPLTAICGYLDLMEQEEKSEELARYLAHIGNRVEALKNLTEELFRYSVVVSVEDMKIEQIDLKRTLEDNLLSFYGIMQEKEIIPEISFPEKEVWRDLDKNAVNRVFSNIISNALKYTDKDFTVSMDPSGCITFSNTAKGLNPVLVGKLFDRFYTVEANRNSTGLGLSIAKVLMERMGGRIGAGYHDDKLFIVLDF